ncbi:DbpA RNA binding domain-containing protein, partial [Leisingera sp. ANG-S]
EDLRPADTPEPRKERKERKAFGPSVWFSLSGGREAGADPRKVLPMLCKAGNIDRDAIGAIRVQDNETFAEISKDAVEGFLKALDGKTELEPGAVLTQLAEAPELAPAPRRGPGGPKGGFKGDRKPHRGKDDGAKPYRAKSDHREDSRPPRKEWSDKPERKERSDKTAGKDWGGKPARKDWDSKPARKEDRPSKPKPAVTAKPKGASDPSKRMTRPGAPAAKPFKAKGPKPPVGKPNSKKNKARAAAAVSAKGGKGGDARPKRKPAGPAKHR